ncbi:MAG: glycoside-pentoside-hexuronide (GPH):cation symporter [Desulfobacter sp.]
MNEHAHAPGHKSAALAWGVKLSYALPALALAVIGIPIYVFLPKFYTDTVGISISTVGILLLIVRLFDAVTDPVIGYVSDSVSTAFGRRRPFIALGAAGLSISLWFLFVPPVSSGAEATGISPAYYFGFWLFALFFFWTLITIPYESLGPELTPNHHERTGLFGLRDGFLILGTLLAAASSWLISLSGERLGLTLTENDRFRIMATVYAPLILLFAGICIWKVRETPVPDSQRTGKATFLKGLLDVLKNRPFVILLAGYPISAFGSNLPATLILYYVEYVLQAENAEGFLLIYFLTGILFLPLWVVISRKMGKRNAWIASMAVNTGAFAGVFFLGPGDAGIYALLVFISGIGFGAGLALPSSIQADVIDYDELMTGQRREGRYIGLWSIAKKLSAAAGVGIGLVLLGHAGYQPNVVQGQDTADMLRILYALVPCLCNALSMIILWFYPITQARHEQIRAEIDRKKSRGQ